MKVLPSNIMLSYPVKWSKQQVLRDIVQNFYDDAGIHEFERKFKSEYLPEVDGGKLVLSAESAGFNYEWLLHIGASTKQSQTGKYAGFYGEGFKIASLCALRDFHWQINMRSKDWSMEVSALDTCIDGCVLKQLFYIVEEGLDESPVTELHLNNFSEKDYALLKSVLCGFYYSGNPLIGKLIYKSEYAAIHERSQTAKPEHFVRSYDISGDGIVFIEYQARSEFTVPLVICNHRFKTPDRERNNVYFCTVLDVLIDLVDLIDISASRYLLEQLEKRWYDYPDKKEDLNSWYSLIRKLIRKIVYYDPFSAVCKDFVRDHPNLVVCEQPRNKRAHSRKTQALTWKKLHLPESRLVQDSFAMFGYKTIEYLCEKAGGFNITRPADQRECQLLSILKNAAKDIFIGFIIYYPLCLVIENDSSVFNGCAHLSKNEKTVTNSYGMRIRYTLSHIEIKKSLLARGSFSEAFSTYSHELCHCFGGDASASFSLALTHVITLTMAAHEKLLPFANQWDEIFNVVYP